MIIKNVNEQKVVPFFKINGKNFSFQMDELTPFEKISLEKENLMLAILNTINDGVVTIDFNMRITSFNKAAEKITGYSAQEAIGKRCMDIFCAGGFIDIPKCLADCTMKMAVAEEKPITRKKKIVNKNGEVITISSTASILHDLDGHPIGGMATFVDITAFEKLKEECKGRKYIMGNIIGKSSKMMEIYDLVDSISESRANVLIQGETGTGKGLIANAIHFSSIYQKGPFVHVNCASLPENLLETELFGHVKGAFTGAVSDRQGRLEIANGGTLFLDEIGELSLMMQAKLLKVVEEKQFEKVGGAKTIKADIRIISATNKDLKKAIQNNTFREDLYYRLNVIPIYVPPLRDRSEDIPVLIKHFIDKLNTSTRKNIEGVTSRVIDLFSQYPWPGNVREMENVMEYAFLHCKGDHIDLQHLPPAFRFYQESPSSSSETYSSSIPSNGGSSKSIDLNSLLKVLEECRWSKSETARRLHISRTTLWRLMKQYELY